MLVGDADGAVSASLTIESAADEEAKDEGKNVPKRRRPSTKNANNNNDRKHLQKTTLTPPTVHE